MHSTEEIIQEAATLPIEQRILIVDSILRTLNKPNPDMDAKWAKVAMQRLDELDRKSVV